MKSKSVFGYLEKHTKYLIERQNLSKYIEDLTDFTSHLDITFENDYIQQL